MSDEAALWLHNFKQIMSFVDVAHDNFRAAPNSRGVAEKSVKEGLRLGVFHHLLDEREREAISSVPLRGIVERVRSAVDDFLNEHLTTPQQLVSRLGEIASLAGEAVETINELPDEEDVVQVVDEFETRYLVTLATTMSAHHTLATKLVELKESDGQFFDIATYAFVSEPGPGRVHVADLNNAMDSGAGSYSFTRGMVSYDRFPPVQTMIYGQWFAYIHAVWDEWYRPRLAAAYSRTLGEAYLKNDIKSDFMGELNKIRNDVIHNKARVKESARNRILDWGTSDGLVGMTPEKMFGLRGSFPRDELLTPPVSGEVSTTQNIPWTADIQLINSVKQRLAELEVPKRQQKDIGDEMLRLWLDANSMPATAAVEQGRGN